MGVTYGEKTMTFEGVVGEEEAKTVRDYLQTTAPEQVEVNLQNCGDIHTAIIQILAAYHLQYGCDFVFGEAVMAYQKALEGCVIVE